MIDDPPLMAVYCQVMCQQCVRLGLHRIERSGSGRSCHLHLSPQRPVDSLFLTFIKSHTILVRYCDPMAISPTTKKVIIDGGRFPNHLELLVDLGSSFAI